MMNPRPMSTRRTVQLLVILTILAWATQTLFHQWGFGGLILPQPRDTARPRAVMLELRSQAWISDSAKGVTLRDVCRWSPIDAETIARHADVPLRRPADKDGVINPITVADIRAALQEAGVSLVTVQFCGAATCAIRVGDDSSEASRLAALQAEPLTDAAPSGLDAHASAPPAASAPAAASPAATLPAEIVADAPQTPLRELLVAPLLARLAAAEEDVRIDFDAKDEAVLALTSPARTFTIDATRAGDLGKVAWDVAIKDQSGEERLVTVAATARVWEEQLVVTRALSQGQSIAARDLKAAKVLVEARQPSPLSSSADAVGQLAARDLKAGETISADDLLAPAVVTKGDFITVSMQVGPTRVETVARAMAAGAKGSVIKAKNEATRDVYRVVVTGASAGDVIGE